MPDLRALRTHTLAAYPGHGALTRERAHHTDTGPQTGKDNEKGLQP